MIAALDAAQPHHPFVFERPLRLGRHLHLPEPCYGKVQLLNGIAHLGFAIEEFRAMKMAPSLERALAHKS